MEADQFVYSHTPRRDASPSLLEECRALFNHHYGKWSDACGSRRAGTNIRLSRDQIQAYLDVDGGRVVTARHHQNLVGYAFAVRFKGELGVISWITQLVVHTDFRNRGISKQLLSGVWAFSDDFAWGLVSANPYAIRALEKATRRRCDPTAISQVIWAVIPTVAARVAYVDPDKCIVGPTRSVVDTGFHVDRSDAADRLAEVTHTAKWTLGDLGPAEEWLALTTRDQPQLSLSASEWERIMSASRDIAASGAYDRMALGVATNEHPWTRHAAHEVSSIMEMAGLVAPGKILDFGCGEARHALLFAEKGFSVTAVDFSKKFIDAVSAAVSEHGADVKLIHGDCRTFSDGTQYDAAICLYDVVGSFVSDDENRRIVANLVRNVKVGAYVVLSVMNRTLTERIARHFGDVAENPNLLLKLPPSATMEATGGVFDPNYYLCDKGTGVVYRREQFQAGDQLPLEVLVCDRRYTTHEIRSLCEQEGLETVLVRPVQLGRWNVSIPADDMKAKEIIYVGRKLDPSLQQ